MKVYDSDMPTEVYWNSLFDIDNIINWLNIKNIKKQIIEIGCGYGTFTIPIAQKVKTKIICYDIDQEMINTTKKNLDKCSLSNYELINCDVLESGIIQEVNSCAMVLLFNLLHFNERISLLKETKKVIGTNGVIAVIHWRNDIPTPRGPALEIRPSPDDIIKDAESVGLKLLEKPVILEPYHWGIKLG